MTIYERIKELRLAKNMTQDELAEAVGYKSKTAISKIERGERDISQSMIVKYAEALDTTPTYLLCGDTESAKDNDLKELCGKETVIYNRDGRVIKTKLNEEQIKYLEKFIESLSGENHDHI